VLLLSVGCCVYQRLRCYHGLREGCQLWYQHLFCTYDTYRISQALRFTGKDGQGARRQPCSRAEMGQAGPYTPCALLARHGYRQGLETAVMAFYEPRNDKAPAGLRGALTWQGGCLTLKLLFERDESLTGCSSPVNHPTTPCSGMLVGETTRSITLNSDRGGGPLNAQRVVGKREPQPEQSGEK